MNILLSHFNAFNNLTAYAATKIQDLGLFGLRLYTSWVFFPAGLLKIKDWGSTLFLFEEEYSVPLLSPVVAAWLGTVGELLFPFMLTLGFLGRFAAGGLFVVNAVAVISLASVAPAAMSQHLLWGLALMVIIMWGSGKLSVDHVISVLARKAAQFRV